MPGKDVGVREGEGEEGTRAALEVEVAVGRTPAQVGGSSSSGQQAGGSPSLGPAPPAPLEAVPERTPMTLDPESRKRTSEDRDESPKRRGGVVPAGKAAGQRRRGPEDQGGREESRNSTGTRSVPIVVAAPEATEMDDAPILLNLERERVEERRASKEVKDEFQTGDEKKGPRLTHPNMDSVEAEDVLMNRLEIEEKKTLHIATEDYYMAMTTCEDGVDASYVESGKCEDAWHGHWMH